MVRLPSWTVVALSGLVPGGAVFVMRFNHALLLIVRANWLTHMAALFVCRHWLLSLANEVFTAVLGLGILAFGRRLYPPMLTPRGYLFARLIVLLVSLYKGAFFLVIGDSRARGPFGFFNDGVQVPDPYDLFGLTPQTSISVWRTTSIGHDVIILALLSSGALAGWRLLLMTQAHRALVLAAQVSSLHGVERIRVAVATAAVSIGCPTLAATGVLVVESLPGPNPFIIGLLKPNIVITRDVAGALSDSELEMAMRHELDHIRRHDHWTRWLMVLLRDIATCTGIAGWLFRQSLEIVEHVCDMDAIRQRKDASSLARAISIAVGSISDAHRQAAAIQAFSDRERQLAQVVNPGLLGLRACCEIERQVIQQRLHNILVYARSLNGPEIHKGLRDCSDVSDCGTRRAGTASFVSVLRTSQRALSIAVLWGLRLVFVIALAFVLYAKFFVLINIS